MMILSHHYCTQWALAIVVLLVVESSWASRPDQPRTLKLEQKLHYSTGLNKQLTRHCSFRPSGTTPCTALAPTQSHLSKFIPDWAVRVSICSHVWAEMGEKSQFRLHEFAKHLEDDQSCLIVGTIGNIEKFD